MTTSAPAFLASCSVTTEAMRYTSKVYSLHAQWGREGGVGGIRPHSGGWCGRGKASVGVLSQTKCCSQDTHYPSSAHTPPHTLTPNPTPHPHTPPPHLTPSRPAPHPHTPSPHPTPHTPRQLVVCPSYKLELVQRYADGLQHGLARETDRQTGRE